MLISELGRVHLDYWVGTAHGMKLIIESWPMKPRKPIACWRADKLGRPMFTQDIERNDKLLFNPSQNVSLLYDILIAEKVKFMQVPRDGDELARLHGPTWISAVGENAGPHDRIPYMFSGTEPTIQLCRAYIAWKYQSFEIPNTPQQ